MQLPTLSVALSCALILATYVPSSGGAADERLRSAITWVNSRAEFKPALTRHINTWRQQDQTGRRGSHEGFDCPEGKPSAEVPNSVHRLRAGDIDIVAAMGDSNTAANGAKAFTLMGCTNEYRGVSWSIGSDSSLDMGVTTLPNILKKFNPLLYGASTGRGDANGRRARFNVAVPGSKASDMPEQASKLVQKLKSDRLVSMEKGWKFITMLVGGNDLCQFCEDPDAHDARSYAAHIQEALDILQQHVPRALVNIVSYFDLTQITDMSESFICDTLHVTVCGCAFTHTAEVRRAARLYQAALRQLAESGRYDSSDDFTVVYQPFLEDATIPTETTGEFNMSYLAPDCFHFSQKGQELVATTLWNALFEPVGSKRTEWRTHDKLQCPTAEFPFIATTKNSQRLLRNETDSSN